MLQTIDRSESAELWAHEMYYFVKLNTTQIFISCVLWYSSDKVFLIYFSWMHPKNSQINVSFNISFVSLWTWFLGKSNFSLNWKEIERNSDEWKKKKERNLNCEKHEKKQEQQQKAKTTAQKNRKLYISKYSWYRSWLQLVLPILSTTQAQHESYSHTYTHTIHIWSLFLI